MLTINPWNPMKEYQRMNCVEWIVQTIGCEITVEEAFDLVDFWCSENNASACGRQWELAVTNAYETLRELAKIEALNNKG